MRGRLYDPRVTGFISPDPMASGDAQALNRYSYVRNSPVTNIDPTGLYPDAPPPAFNFKSLDELASSLDRTRIESELTPPIPA
jgi:hypothetical protein